MRSDFCAHVNWLSSIEYQKHLTKELKSEQDRERYLRIIEMSKTIQQKLEHLQDKRPKLWEDTKNLTWSSSLHVKRMQHHVARSGFYTFHPSMVTKTEDPACSRPSIDTVFDQIHSHRTSYSQKDESPTANPISSSSTPINELQEALIDEDEQNDREKANYTTTSSSSKNSQLTRSKSTSCTSFSIEEDDDEEEEIYPTSDIHVAVRRNASLFKLNQLKDNANPNCPLSSTQPKNYLTPPDSPQIQQELDLSQMIRIHKRSRQSLKGLLRRTYQLNQYSISKTNSIPFSTQGLIFKTVNPGTGESKMLLKLVIVPLTTETPESQRRFGFTFWWQKQDQERHQDHAKLVFAPDSLVKEALYTWVNMQNQDNIVQIPSLQESDEILRDGRKLYVVYSAKLFCSRA